MKLPKKVPVAGFLGFAAFFLIPIAFAAAQGLVPCGTASGAQNYMQATACNLCDLGRLVQGIINFLIGLAIPAAALLIAWAGVLYFTAGGDTGKYAKAIGIFKHVILGFVLALTGWLIVQTVLYAVFKDSYYRGWNNIQCSDNRPRSAPISSILNPLNAPATGGTTVTPGSGGGPQASVYCDELGMCWYNQTPYTPGEGGDVYTQTEALANLAAGISLKEGASLNGVQPTTIEYANSVRSACNCEFVITEGTGGTHAPGTFSHANGYKLDIRSKDNPALYNWVTSNGTLGNWSNGTPTWTINGTTWALEGRGTANEHWDVVHPVR